MKSWTALASKSKSLALVNKSLDVGKATKKHSALRDASRAERAEFYFDPFCQLAPAATRLGPSSVPTVARTQIIANSKSPCIFWTTAQVGSSSHIFAFSPSKVRHGDIYLAPGGDTWHRNQNQNYL